ncbi:MAG: Hsp20/alpha crystallin family protein [Candidatus Colwellbacteria bacterium]|jgi:HSP20 family protein|nr:Hsp20/alpha crystallin family protein [Candidatus Colwellbacteria bacterium]MCK9497367.1 Hsp20/alpha crystallin family protein [Candidatus Colwellbacteria bacterium]MDD3752721.1 Hsp20/alpha crystallin family protein [Candidatus Colwellbacteria bacterium]MDD4819009.1 Hsp20/alpha crystallin family protein [Candidatus Colwellbacteria bacterium]
MKSKKPEKDLDFFQEESEGQLTIDVYQTDDEIVIESTVAGVDPDDIDIDISSESVTIRGERARSEKIDEENYLYQECYWGKFSRSIILPQEIDPDKAKADFKNGVLQIKLPKITKGKTRKLKIKSD